MRSILLLAIGLACSHPAGANPLKSPRRFINGQTVDLNVLFKWWTNHTGSRPLTGWIHVSGSIVGTNSWGWIIEPSSDVQPRHKTDGEESSEPVKSPSRILLLHPPLNDLVEFERAKAKLQQLNQQREELVKQETVAKSRADALARQEKGLNHNSAEAHALGRETKQLNQLSDQAKSELKLLDRQIQPLKIELASYPNQDRYRVDCFALETDNQAQGLAVYDHGSTLQ